MHRILSFIPWKARRVICGVLVVFSVSFSTDLSAKMLAVPIQAEAGIVMNADTGAILFEKKAREKHFPASITKIATAAYALHRARNQLDVMITAQKDAVSTVPDEAMHRSKYTLPPYRLITGASSAGIKEGEILSFKDLLYGMMLASGGDASNVIAMHVSGSVPDFMVGVNEYVKKIGCSATTFCNPHGLHHPKQVTTAYDMALLTKEAMKDPLFREVVSATKYTRPKTNKQEATLWLQKNKLLRSGPYFYPKAIGVKTGYYSLAGSTLVAAATDGDRTLIVVLLKVKERKDLFLDAIKLFEAAFAQPKVRRVVLKKGEQKMSVDLDGADSVVPTYTQGDLALEYYPAEEPLVKCFLQWDHGLALPVVKDQRVGELVLLGGEGHVYASEPLYAAGETSATLLHRTRVFFNKWVMGISFGKIAVIALIAALIGYFVFYRRKFS